MYPKPQLFLIFDLHLCILISYFCYSCPFLLSLHRLRTQSSSKTKRRGGRNDRHAQKPACHPQSRLQKHHCVPVTSTLSRKPVSLFLLALSRNLTLKFALLSAPEEHVRSFSVQTLSCVASSSFQSLPSHHSAYRYSPLSRPPVLRTYLTWIPL